MSRHLKLFFVITSIMFLAATSAPAIEYAGVKPLGSRLSFYAGAMENPQPGGVSSVTGIYVTDGVHTDGSLDPGMLGNNSVDGFLLRVTWASLEPTEGVFDWTQIDNDIAQAAGANKSVTIAVAVGAYAPGWLYVDGAQSFKWVWNSTFNFPICSVQKMPLPWDPVFISKWNVFLNAFGARYDSNPTVAGIKVSTVNSQSWETGLPASVNKKISSGKTSCTGYDDVSNWQKAGYTRTLMENTWDNMMAQFAAAFPHKQLIPMLLPAGFPAIDEYGKIFSGKEHAISEHILASGSAAYGGQFGAQNNALSASWIWPTLESYAPTTNTGYQTLSKLGNSLDTAANLAISGGAHFLELYKADLSSQTLVPTVQSIHNQLQ